jgi:hypothetical protein
MVPPAEDEFPPLAALELELELELHAARAPGMVTSPAVAASPLRADRLLNWGSSVEDVRFIATPCKVLPRFSRGMSSFRPRGR